MRQPLYAFLYDLRLIVDQLGQNSMTLDPDAAINALALVVDAMRGNAKLQTWFHEFASLSEDARRDAVTRAAREMRAQHASEELVVSFGLLSHPPLFAAILSVLEECGVRV